MKVYGYARVSTEEQVKSGSLQQQKDAIKDYCKARGYELVHLYSDAGVSALSHRPEWSELMKRLESGGAEAVVVTKLDRWGRSVKDLVTSIDQIHQWGISFVSIGDSIDTSTPNGRLLFHVLSAFAQFDRENIKERLAAGRERARAQGKTLHRPRKQLDMREIKRLYVEIGLSASAIAKLMGVSHNTILSRLREMGVEIK